MIPVNEGNDECRKCKRFDMCYGGADTYGDGIINQLPSCGRDVIISQKDIKELAKKENKNGKRQIFKFMQRKNS